MECRQVESCGLEKRRPAIPYSRQAWSRVAANEAHCWTAASSETAAKATKPARPPDPMLGNLTGMCVQVRECHLEGIQRFINQARRERNGSTGVEKTSGCRQTKKQRTAQGAGRRWQRESQARKAVTSRIKYLARGEGARPPPRALSESRRETSSAQGLRADPELRECAPPRLLECFQTLSAHRALGRSRTACAPPRVSSEGL